VVIPKSSQLQSLCTLSHTVSLPLFLTTPHLQLIGLQAHSRSCVTTSSTCLNFRWGQRSSDSYRIAAFSRGARPPKHFPAERVEAARGRIGHSKGLCLLMQLPWHKDYQVQHLTASLQSIEYIIASAAPLNATTVCRLQISEGRTLGGEVLNIRQANIIYEPN